MKEQSGVQSVERAFTVLELLCKNGNMGLTALSAAAGLHKSTVYRLLSTLCNLGYVSKNGSTDEYFVTLKFLKISSLIMAKNDIRKSAKPFLERLSRITGETAHLVERSGNDIIYIDKFESTENSVRMVSRIGLSLPMVYTAVGKAIMSCLNDKEIYNIWHSTEITPKTDKTITDFGIFTAEIERVRALGYAVDDEENETGVKCIGAAIPDVYGNYRYAFSVSAPISRMTDEKTRLIAKAVIETKNEIINI